MALVDPLPAGLEVMNPELAVTGYPPRDLLLRPGFVRQSMEVLDRLAKKHRVRAVDLAEQGRTLDPSGIANRTSIDTAMGVAGK